ncbi:MAG: hypothetical protein O2925_08325 [Actinomycetota bacterium]|jgi:hypothetical protein|nr:hypothetical protein [Actinomycetota bacterium]MDA3015604.1 hypothetical protein [Actinomycetota bacterium]MDA3028791.1 hypothetical protein [Actinomycetota bacterium]
MAWQPRVHWDWLVTESQLAPAESEYSTTHSCDICGAWLIRRVEHQPGSIRVNSDDNRPDRGVVIEDSDPVTALLAWSVSGGEIAVKCECGWPHTLRSDAGW